MSAAVATPDAVRPVCPLCANPTTRLHRLAHTTSWRCEEPACGLRFASPAPSDAELDEFYRTLYYPDASPTGGSFEDTPAKIFGDLVHSLGDALGIESNARILDFGAGRGELCRVALELGLRPTGIERDAHARAYATRDAAFPVFASVEDLVRQDSDARFDTIILWQVIEHLREPWRELASLRGLLAEGGRLVVATPNARSLKARLQGASWDNVVNPTHLYYFTPAALKRTLEAAGFDPIERLRVISDFPHHGRARRITQKWLRIFGLDGDLVFSARRGSRPT
jgi:2-polyprenyl-3-methyl-5-hydroxy-6-metoxy-1,4-benzoquinol methylase